MTRKDTETVSVAEFAARTGLAPRTVTKWCTTGRLQASKNEAGDWRILQPELESIAAERERTGQRMVAAGHASTWLRTYAPRARRLIQQRLLALARRVAAANAVTDADLGEVAKLAREVDQIEALSVAAAQAAREARAGFAEMQPDPDAIGEQVSEDVDVVEHAQRETRALFGENEQE